MNAKQILGLSALASALAMAAGIASAQTVPAEQWVGAPIPAVSTFSRAAVVSDYYASAGSMSLAPQEMRVGPPDAPVGAVRREEAVADLNLWNRSGLGQIAYGNDFDPGSARFQSKIANYQRMRQGPAYFAEVDRVKHGGASSVTATARTQAGSDGE